MPTEIERILAKDHWTGDDVGRAIILSLIHSYRDTLAARPETTLFDAAQLRTMVASLKTREQTTRYNRYTGLNHWISINQPIAMFHYQKADSEIMRIMSVLSTASAAEDTHRYIEQLPAIVTPRQLDEAQAARVQALLDGEGPSVAQLITLATGHYLRKLAESPRKANPLGAVRKAYRRAPVTHPAFLPAREPPEDETLEEATRHVTARAQAIMDGVPPPDEDKAPPPGGLTKWDVIVSGVYVKAPPEALADELPALCEAMLAEIEAKLPEAAGLPALAGLPVGAWAQTHADPRVLYEADAFGYRAWVHSDAAVFAGDARAVANGVAVLRPGSPHVDPDTGQYTPPDIASPLATIGLEQFTPANPDYRQRIEALEASYQAIADTYYYVLGFDRAVELIAAFIDIPDFVVFRMGAPVLSERINAMNLYVPLLYMGIHDRYYADEAAKAQKLALLRERFAPVDLSALVIPDGAVAAAQAMLEDNMRAFEAQDGVFTRTLCIRGEGA